MSALWKQLLAAFSLLLIAASAALAADTGSVSGQILQPDGKPLADGVLLFFDRAAGPPPAPGRYWRLPDIGGRLGQEGRFQVDLPAGDYYFGVMKVPDKNRSGFPTREDWLYLGRDKQGDVEAYAVASGQQLDLGALTTTTFAAASATNGVVLLEGVIRDANATPVADAVVELYPAEGNSEIPLFQSERTSANGRYRLQAAPGTYVVRAFSVPESKNLTHARNFEKGEDGDKSGGPAMVTLAEGKSGITMDVPLTPAPAPGR